MKEAASTLGLEIFEVIKASTPGEIDAAFHGTEA